MNFFFFARSFAHSLTRSLTHLLTHSSLPKQKDYLLTNKQTQKVKVKRNLFSVLCCALVYSPISRPLPTVIPTISRIPLLKIPSTNKRAKNPIIAARLFNLSAFSTNPNLGGGTTGLVVGWVTPFGAAEAVTNTTRGRR